VSPYPTPVNRPAPPLRAWGTFRGGPALPNLGGRRKRKRKKRYQIPLGAVGISPIGSTAEGICPQSYRNGFPSGAGHFGNLKSLAGRGFRSIGIPKRFGKSLPKLSKLFR
jgi:hypothetical protein